jgi:hypothetical protein
MKNSYDLPKNTNQKAGEFHSFETLKQENMKTKSLLLDLKATHSFFLRTLVIVLLIVASAAISKAQCTITLTSGSGSDNQAFCIGGTLTPSITYYITGSYTGVTVNGLPNGVAYHFDTPSSTLTISGTPTQSSTFYYEVVLDGCSQTASGIIAVYAPPVLILNSGNKDQTVCVNSPISQIKYFIDGASSGSVTGLPSGVTPDFEYAAHYLYINGSPEPIANGSYSYMVTTSNGEGCGDSHAYGTITVNPLPTAYTITGTGSYCAGGTGLALGLANSDAGINYQLYLGNSPVGLAVSGTGSAISFGLQTASGTYTVVASNTTTSCLSNMTGSATITINPLPAAYNVTGTGSYCAGGTGITIGLANSDAGINYQLYLGNSTVGSPVAGTGSAISFGQQTASGTYTVVATNTNTTCISNMTGSAVITINPLPTAYSVTGTGSYCAGGSGLSIGLANSDNGINYQLYLGNSTVGSPVAGTGSAISFGLQTASGIYTVVANNTTTSCVSNMTGSATITINPLPAAYNVTGTGSYCAGGSGLAIGLANSDAGINYQLYLGNSPVGLAVCVT